MSDRAQTVLRLDKASHEKIKQIAQQEGRSFNNLVERIIRLYIIDYERQHGEIPVTSD